MRNERSELSDDNQARRLNTRRVAVGVSRYDSSHSLRCAQPAAELTPVCVTLASLTLSTPELALLDWRCWLKVVVRFSIKF